MISTDIVASFYLKIVKNLQSKLGLNFAKLDGCRFSALAEGAINLSQCERIRWLPPKTRDEPPLEAAVLSAVLSAWCPTTEQKCQLLPGPGGAKSGGLIRYGRPCDVA